MKIRILTPEGAHRVVPLILYVQDIHATAQPKRYHKDPDPQAIEAWLCDQLSKPNVTAYVADVHGETAGYLLSIRDPAKSNLFSHAPPRIALDQICVLPQFQKQGVATAMIQTMLDVAQAEGITCATTSYGNFNDRSSALMARMGFKPVSIKAERYT